jgi:hypothetical protein
MLIHEIRISSNLDPQFRAILEARMVASLQRASRVNLLKCAECTAVRGRVEDGVWVVQRGIVRKEDLVGIAKKYGARTMLSVSLALNTNPNSLVFDTEVVKAEDSSIIYAEGYRVHPHTAVLYRGADKAQSREAKLKDLEERINARPVFGHGAIIGGMMVPSNHPNGMVFGAYGAYRLSEKFGADREWQYGINLGGFLNPERLAGAIVSFGFWKRLSEQNVYSSSCSVGGTGGAFVTGSPGNTGMVSAMAECLFVHRLALQGSLSYMLPFRYRQGEFFYGGFTPQVGAALLW